MLKRKLQYFGHLMRRVDSLEKTLMLGGIGGKRRRGRWRMRWLDGITDSMDVRSEEHTSELQLLSPSTWHSSHHVISNSAHRFPHRTASIRDFEVVWLLSALSLHLSLSTVFRVRLLIFLPKSQGLLSASCSASDVCFLGSQEDPAIFQRQSFRKG